MKKYLRKIKVIKKKKLLFCVVTIVLSLVSTGILVANNFNAKDKGNRSVYAKQETVIQNNTLPTIFRDSKNGTSLALQLIFDRPDTGQFDFFVPEEGYYRGVIPLTQSGKQIIHPKGTVSAQFYPLNNTTSTQVAVRMEGEINIVHNTASINIWVNDKHYNLTAIQGNVSEGTKVAKQALDYTTSQNWSALYELLSSEVQVSISQTQFSKLMSNNSSPTIIEADLNGKGQIKLVAGYNYFMQPVKLTVRETNGTTAYYNNNYFFVLEQGTWRLLTTDTPTP